MKTASVLKAIKKAGFTPVQDGNQFMAVGEKYHISFFDQNGSAVCLHACRNNEKSDSMTDYHAGFFPKTISFAIECLKEKAA